jgi:starch synthase (maltosyl-transferring)
LQRPESLAAFIGRVNAARRDNPALQSDRGLVFMPTDNPELIAYAKVAQANGQTHPNAVLVVVNLDFHHVQSGWVTLDLDALHLDASQPFHVHDLLTDARYLWSGARNYIELDPARVPAHVFRVRRGVHNERDFDPQGA